MDVGALVMDYGATETEAIGALLHDAPDDCGGRPMLAQIQTTFGQKVALILRTEADLDAWLARSAHRRYPETGEWPSSVVI